MVLVTGDTGYLNTYIEL